MYGGPRLCPAGCPTQIWAIARLLELLASMRSPLLCVTWPVVSSAEKVKILDSFESVVPERGGVEVIVLGNLISIDIGDAGWAERGVSE